MRKITTQDCQKALYERRLEAIAGALSQGKVVMPYNYRQFEMDMLADGFIADARTIRQKWKMLRADEVIIERITSSNGLQTYLVIPTFRRIMGESARALLVDAERGRESETHINDVNGEVDA